MNKTKNTRRITGKSVIAQLLGEISPIERNQAENKMKLAAKIGDLISAKGWSKGEFAEKLNKNPSEVSKWLSGTHNFTIDTLVEISITLNVPFVELFERKVQIVKETRVFIAVQTAESAFNNYQTRVSSVSNILKYRHMDYREPVPVLAN